MSRVLAYLRRHHVGLLALFVALGGTSYAASRIDGARIKDRTVAGKKLKRGAISRRELALKHLGKVPAAVRADRAKSATRAGHASTATSADRASRANSAGLASGAEHANDSSRLGGLGPSAYLSARIVRSSRLFWVGNGATRTVVAASPFTVDVTCQNASPTDIATWRVRSAESHLAFYGDAGQNKDYGVAGAPAPAVTVSRAHGTDGQITTLRDAFFVTPSGAALSLHGYAAVNLPGHVGQCGFAGYVVVP
jgi:hypothetical protein